MEKSIIVAIGLIFTLQTNAGLVDWSSSNWGEEHSVIEFEFWGWGGHYLELQDGWYVGLYNANETGGMDIDTSDLNQGLIAQTTTKVVTTGPSFAHFWGINYKSIDIADNIPVFTVIYDATNKDHATDYAIIDSELFSSGSAHLPATPVEYTLDAPAGSVPEPTTIGLMGIAGMGMFLARKRVHS
jgi:hypothetical protein